MTSAVSLEFLIRKTPLHARHVQLGAKMVDFSGWDMPIQYTSILKEHEAVRKSVGLFDISHMGTVDVTGLNAFDFVSELITNDLGRLTDGKALYSPVCMPSGGIVDDVLVYRMEPHRYRFVINAGNREKDLQWILSHASDKHVDIKAMSEQMSLLAVQGPNSKPLLKEILRVSLDALEYYSFFCVDWNGVPLMVSRTGYTGELGYELFVPTDSVCALWDMLLDKGSRYGIAPIGLGARDTLRMEMGYCLYGHEIDETITPLEAGLAWTVAFGKPRFIGKDALLAQQAQGLSRKLLGLKMQDKSIPRGGCEIVQNGKAIGKLASGGFSPSMQCGIGIGYVPLDIAREGQDLGVRIRNDDHPARTARIPFYKKTK